MAESVRLRERLPSPLPPGPESQAKIKKDAIKTINTIHLLVLFILSPLSVSCKTIFENPFPQNKQDWKSPLIQFLSPSF
jgi:hypothetical protein